MSDFFEQLQIFSERVFAHLGFTEKTSPWQGNKFKNERPIGAILHYTGSSNIRWTLRWFMQRQQEAMASAHVVVADGWPEGWLELAKDLDLVQVLPAAVVQCVPPDKLAWHATWANSTCYGIEMVNAGELRFLDGQWVWWADNWTRPWRAMGAVPKEPILMYGRYWEPYTSEQLLSVIEVSRQVQQLHGSLEPYMVVGHEQVTAQKLDPGPLFPIHGVRQALHEPGVDVSGYQWYRKYIMNKYDGERWRNDAVRGWLGNTMVYLSVDPADVWPTFSQIVQSQFLMPRSGFGVTGKTVLRLLGYYVDSPGVVGLSLEEKRSIEVFQKMMSLKVDGDPGMQTKTGLVARLGDRGILPK